MADKFDNAFNEAENILRMSQAKSEMEKQGKKVLEIREKKTLCSIMSVSEGFEVMATVENLPIAGNEPCACLYLRGQGMPNWVQYFATKVTAIFPDGFDLKTKKSFEGDEPIRIFDAGVRSGLYENGKKRYLQMVKKNDKEGPDGSKN